MDNNTQTPQATPPPNPASKQEPQVLTQQPASNTPPPPSESQSPKNMAVWIIVAVIVLILAVGGVYIYMNRPVTPKLQTTPPQTTSASGTLGDDLNSIDAESGESDFVQVDSDLQKL